MTKIVEEGSRWVSVGGEYFHVIHVVELDGQTWVHYEQDGINQSKEYSCYIESFLARFTETQHDTTKKSK